MKDRPNILAVAFWIVLVAGLVGSPFLHLCLIRAMVPATASIPLDFGWYQFGQLQRSVYLWWPLAFAGYVIGRRSITGWTLAAFVVTEALAIISPLVGKTL